MPHAPSPPPTPPVPPTAAAVPAGRSADWRQELADAVRDAGELCRLLDLPDDLAAEARRAAGNFPLLVPRRLLAAMRPGDPHDPILLQVLPRAPEAVSRPGFAADPLAERAALAAPGLIRKYAGRALVLVTGGCAVNCRYCFRREFPYADSGATAAGVEQACAAVAADDTIAEVILSGGDPLLLDDLRLGRLLERLAAITHLRRLRIHSRLPVVLPARITERLVELLGGLPQTCVLVIHANHPAELAPDVAEALRRLAAARVMLLNQSVLLAGVNDAFETLYDLSTRLVDLGVVPYYLHLLDRVDGAAHFEVPEPRARQLHARLQATLPGYAVPRLVREVPGEPSKSWLA